MDVAQITIAKHSVAQCPEDGLSPLQYDLLHEPKRIRIVDAPTGAGKSYAFQKAILQQQRVLFIVPTRRLAQNLAAGLINDLVKEGWDQTTAEKKVAIFSADQTKELKEQDPNLKGIDIQGYRLRQLGSLYGTRPEGEMIIAVPEIISLLLHRQYLNKGSSSDGIFSLLSDFDHIVFDEFHTIESQGFGLAALFAKLASVNSDEGYSFGKAKVSFLSATPLAIAPTLEKLGVAADHIAHLHEQLVEDEQARPLHGDVQLRYCETDHLPTLLQAEMPLIQAEVKADRQIVVIYNALADLRRDLPLLRASFQQAGIGAEKVLVINSIDDSGANRQSSYGFYAGRKQNPDQFNILIATASVEMGVTFRAANIMFMQSGFAPMNFLQRYGRAARRGADGQVFVAIAKADTDRFPWIRHLRDWIIEHQGQTISVLAFNQLLSQSSQARFETQAVPTEAAQSFHFGELSHHAVYASALYWYLLSQAKGNNRFESAHLRQYQPKQSAHIYKLFQSIETLLNDDDYEDAASQWNKLFLRCALQLRNIGTRVLVKEPDGYQQYVDAVWLQRETSVTHDCTHIQPEKGEAYFQLQGELDDYLLPPDEKNRVQRTVKVYFPQKLDTPAYTADAGLAKQWLKELMDTGDRDTDDAWEDYPEAMQAVKELVRLTGVVACHDTEIEASALIGMM